MGGACRANETRNNYSSLNIFGDGIILLLYLSWTSYEVFKKVLNHLFRRASSLKKGETPVRFDPVDKGSPTFFGCGHLEGHFNSKRAECKKYEHTLLN
jgi:hypothetical protein